MARAIMAPKKLLDGGDFTVRRHSGYWDYPEDD
jgi:hypothetical protein